ncbi:MAG: molecular chaperone DnaJ [Alphaproteobacteria bacterium HGW-Alphaproteobacteria-16]|nr:MAG: molecular chaperone DnaJ [Alphaproteobacteria bacterium HGW-Alphaproteobacteria-16]
MLRYVILIALACLLCRWALGRWPWDYLRGETTRRAALRRARSLLGVEAGASREEVIAAHRRLTALVHPDRGGTNAAMQEATAARDLLLAELPLPGRDEGS